MELIGLNPIMKIVLSFIILTSVCFLVYPQPIKDNLFQCLTNTMKVQAQIMDDLVRVTGKKIDDLQAVMNLLNGADLPTPIQYVNMKS